MVATLGHNGTVADPARDIETVEKAVYIGVIFWGMTHQVQKWLNYFLMLLYQAVSFYILGSIKRQIYLHAVRIRIVYMTYIEQQLLKPCSYIHIDES